jgi:hypothetical protein
MPQERHRVALLAAPAGWSALLIAQAYPLPPEQRPAYRALWALLTESLLKAASHIQEEAFLHMDRLEFAKDVPSIQANSRFFGDYGLGYSPDLAPPASWTQAEFEESILTHTLRPLHHDVLDIQTSQTDALRTAVDLFAGSGALVYLQSTLVEGELYGRATSLWKPLIQDRSMRLFPYLAPVFTASTLAAATESTMPLWACGTTACVRESVEDGGLLVFRQGEQDLVTLLGLTRETDRKT